MARDPSRTNAVRRWHLSRATGDARAAILSAMEASRHSNEQDGSAEPHSERYHRDCTGYTPDEHGDQGRQSAEASSERYQRDSTGYRLEEHPSLAVGEGDGGGGSAEPRRAPPDFERDPVTGAPIMPRDPVTGELDLTRIQEILSPREKAGEGQIPTPPAGWLPSVGAERGTTRPRAERREWQVNVRLNEREYSRLKEAAALYGVHRTTFARMLINRGAGAIVDEERRHRHAFGPDAE
jgi:hypothetical protein